MIYLLIFIFIVFCVYFYDVREYSSGRTTSYFLIFLMFVLLSALRYRVGSDSIFYEDAYDRMPDLSFYLQYLKYDNYLDYQPLWLLIVAIARSISSEFFVLQLIVALIFNSILLYFFNKYTIKPFTAIAILFVSLLFFYYNFEILRESIAVGIFLLNIKNLEEKRWVPYYLLAVLSFMFHISAIFLFFLPLFRYIRFNYWLLFVILFFTIFFVIFKSTLLSLLFSLLFSDVMRTRMELYAEVEFSVLGFIGWFFVRVLLLIPLFMFNIYKKLNEQRFKWFYAAFLLISVLAQVLYGFDRLLNYLFPVYILLIVDFLHNYYSQIESKLLKFIIVFSIVVHVIFILEYRLVLKNEWGQRFSSVYFPYTTILNPREIPEREEYNENFW